MFWTKCLACSGKQGRVFQLVRVVRVVRAGFFDVGRVVVVRFRRTTTSFFVSVRFMGSPINHHGRLLVAVLARKRNQHRTKQIDRTSDTPRAGLFAVGCPLSSFRSSLSLVRRRAARSGPERSGYLAMGFVKYRYRSVKRSKGLTNHGPTRPLPIPVKVCPNTGGTMSLPIPLGSLA